MSRTVFIETERLLLRDWHDDDAEPFATLNGDPRVMEFFPKRLARAESDAAMARIRAFIADQATASTPSKRRAAGPSSAMSASARYCSKPPSPRRPRSAGG